jgi:predicted aspartyl protease
MKENTHQALTIRSNGGLLRVITCPVLISMPFIPGKNNNDIKTLKVVGLWDTGASNSVINKVVADKLGLKPIAKTTVHTASDTVIANVYLVNIILPSNVIVGAVRVTEGKIKGADMLIGMDIITHGDFSITNKNGQTVMSFCTPSSIEIDFVKAVNTQETSNRRSASLKKYSPKKAMRNNKKAK